MRQSDRGIRRQAMPILAALWIGFAGLVVGEPALALPTSFQSEEGIDLGYSGLPRVFVDVNRDRQADFCRFVGDDPHHPFIACLLAERDGFASDQFAFQSKPLQDLGYDWGPRELADVNGDGRADFCRFVGDPHEPSVGCILAESEGFSGFSSDEWGFKSFPLQGDQGDSSWPRAFADVNGDGRADFCRFVGNADEKKIKCTKAQESNFGGDFYVPVSGGIKAGRPDLPRGFVDANGDGFADFCQFVQDGSNGAKLECTNLNPRVVVTWPGGSYVKVPSLPRAFADVNGDRDAEFCMSEGNLQRLTIRCTSVIGGGDYWLRREFYSDQGIFGGAEGSPYGFANVDGDEQADFCRFTAQRKLVCALGEAQTNVVLMLRHGKICGKPLLAPGATDRIKEALDKYRWFKCESGAVAQFYIASQEPRFKETAEAIEDHWSRCLFPHPETEVLSVADTSHPTELEIRAIRNLYNWAVDTDSDRVSVTVFVLSQAILVGLGEFPSLGSDWAYGHLRGYRSGANGKRLVRIEQTIDTSGLCPPLQAVGQPDP